MELRVPEPLRSTIAVDAETGLCSLRHSFILTSGRLISDWGVADFAQLDHQAMEVVRALAPELIILGTGTRLRFPAAEITGPLQAAGIGLEVMDTPAACRTFNLLASDGRHVAAAIII
ncbi:MAG TPA: hypothetical protein ENK40_00710 [Gammaproteobacteria bacterium]|nr:hypothetical protein [Gammaproteobacteria bacterium]